jgi:phage terminase large subunit-like protein
LGEVRPSTAGAASKDGGKESFAVVDEPHLYYLPELRQMHAMVRRNTRKRKIAQPWMLATTTMFQPGQHSVAEDLYDEAEKLMEQQKRSFGFCWHHREGVMTESNWDDDVAQLASLKEAYGPAADWMDLAGMIEHEIRAPGSVKAENARYFHNLRWKGDQRAINPEKWDALAAPNLNPLGGEFIAIGFDGSDRGEHADDTVLVGWVLTEKPHLFLINAWKRPEFAGRDYRVPREEIREKVTELREQFEVRRFACDPPGWREEIDSWEKEFGERFGEPVVVEVLTNRPTRMGPAIDRFLEAIDEQSFTHDGSPELRDYALNALLTKSKGRSDLPAIVKPTIDAKIDGLVAAILSYDEVAKMPPEQPVAPFALLA